MVLRVSPDHQELRVPSVSQETAVDQGTRDLEDSRASRVSRALMDPLDLQAALVRAVSQEQLGR